MHKTVEILSFQTTLHIFPKIYFLAQNKIIIYLKAKFKYFAIYPFMTSPSSYPIVGVGALIFNKEGKILIGARSKTKKYGFPGGHFEYQESFAECASRELQEEAGLNIKESQLKLFCFLNVIDKKFG